MSTRTQCLTVVSVIAACLTAPSIALSAGIAVRSAQQHTRRSIPWFERALVGMEIGPTGAQFGHSDPTDTRYCAKFNGREAVRMCATAGGEYLVIWARDGDYAYYDSKLLPKAPGLGKRDLLREVVSEARKLRLPVLAYCVAQQGGHYLKAHPEYEMRGIDGRPLGRFCYNSGYLDAMKAILAEQLASGIDGFHLDMLDQGFGAPYGCWCDSCKRLFEKEFGHPMPSETRWDAAWDDMLAFRYLTSARFERALRAQIRSINARATVDFNYHGNPPFSFEVGQLPVMHAGNGDFVTGETGQWGFSALGVGLNAEFYRAATPGRPFQVAMQRGVRMYHDQTTRPLADIRWELFTLLAHGAFVTMVDKTSFDGRLDPVAYQRIGEAFREARSMRSDFGQAPAHDVGIYFSSRTRDWLGRERPAGYFQSFLGAHKACAYEHLPFGVILDENASHETLKRFPVVCVPNAGIVSDKEAAMFRSYVEHGGRLLITGQSGQFDRMGRPLPSCALSDLIGANAVGRLDSTDNWVRLDAKSVRRMPVIARSVPVDWPFLTKGPATVYRPTTATPIGALMKPYRTTRQKEGKETIDWPMSPEAEAGPAVLVNRVGKGVVLTLACSPDFATASDHHIVEARKLFTNAVRYLNPTPRIEINAPANIEAVVTDDPATRTARIHLISYIALPQGTPAENRPYVLPGLMEDAPLFRATIRCRFRIKRVETGKRSTRLSRSGSRIEVTVNDIHDVVRVRY